MSESHGGQKASIAVAYDRMTLGIKWYESLPLSLSPNQICSGPWGPLQVIGLLVLGYLAYARSQDALEELAEDKFRLGIEAVSKGFLRLYTG